MSGVVRIALFALGASVLVFGAGCSSDGSAGATGGVAGQSSGGGGGLAGAAGSGGAAGMAGSGGLSDACGTGPLAPSSAPLPSEILNAAPDIEPRAGTDRLEIWLRKSSTLDAGDVASFQSRACEALKFNLERLELDPAVPEMKEAVRVVVLDVSAYDVATDAPGTYGVAFSAWGKASDALVVPEDAIGDLVNLDDTLAHEENHIVAMRFTPYVEIPNWASEGLAIGIGSHFGMKLHGVPTDFVKSWVDGANGADAELTFQRYDVDDLTTTIAETGHDQALSAFFVEYLRVKHPHGAATGFANEHVALFGAMRQSNDGAAFGDAFSAAHDTLDLETTKGDFEKFLDATLADPKARYGGTVFE